MDKIVTILITAWTIAPNGHQLVERWHIRERHSLQVCMQMQSIMSVAGSAGAIIIKCGEPKDFQ